MYSQIHALTLKTAPSGQLLTTAEAKAHLKVDHSDEDALIDSLVAAATSQCEAELRRALINQTWELRLDCFPECGVIELPFGANSVVGVTYVDEDGATQTLAPDQYVVDVDSVPGRLCRADLVTWPSTERRPNAVVVEMVCGFGAAAGDVPEGIRAWVKVQLGSLYRNREAFAMGASVVDLPSRFTDALLDRWRLIVV